MPQSEVRHTLFFLLNYLFYEVKVTWAKEMLIKINIDGPSCNFLIIREIMVYCHLLTLEYLTIPNWLPRNVDYVLLKIIPKFVKYLNSFFVSQSNAAEL